MPQNHIGDWGTQFGMLVEQILDEGIDASQLDAAGGRGALPAGESRGSRPTRSSPSGPGAGWSRCSPATTQTRAIWRQLIDISLAGFNAAYDRLNVLLTDDRPGR